MRRRFPLLLKKRGRRRTGSPLWARLGETLYHAMFVVAGVVGIWWSLSDVLLPELRLAQEAKDFPMATCRILAQNVAERPGLVDPEYCAELLIEFTPEGERKRQVWTRQGVGRDTPSREEAKAALARWQVGQMPVCWYNPDDPSQVLLSVKRRWWPWMVLVVPLSLLAIGAVGLVRTLAMSQASAERLRARMAKGLDLGALDPTAPRSTIASGLPPAELAEDSPGAILPHRLATDSATGWRVAGMATLCLLWNVLVALFAYQIGAGYLSSWVRAMIALAPTAPLAVIGWRMTRSTWRDATRASTRLELAESPLRVGQRVAGALLHTGPARLQALEITLLCEEIATFKQGTDSRTATAEVSRVPVLSERRLVVPADKPLRRDFEVETPADGPHSFVAPHNEIRWLLEVKLTHASREPRVRRFPLSVHPPQAADKGGKV